MAKLKYRLWRDNIQRAFITLTILGAASGVGYIFRHVGFPDTNVVLIYLLAVLITAWLTNSFAYGFIASILAAFLFNYLFAEPFFAFALNDPNYIVTFTIMTFTALVTSTLTSHAKRSAAAAQGKEAETKAIYNLTNRLSDAKGIDDIASIAVSALSEYFCCDIAFLCFDENGKPERTFVKQLFGEQASQIIETTPEMEIQIEGLRTGFNAGKIAEEYFDWPVNGRENLLGIICVPIETANKINEAQMRLLGSMIKNTALAMDRFWSAEQRIISREEIVKERYRANLLRAISHDIRTPISSIMGTSEMIADMTKPDDPRYALACGIRNDADWLHSLVENILNLTRLQDGKLALQKQPEAVEEVIGEAIGHIAKRAPEYEIEVSVPDELLLVPMDARLIVQVIINLLDNAIKHTKPGKEISIAAELDKHRNAVNFVVKDSGCGIQEKDLQSIFKLFYTKDTGRVGAGNSMGLGLAICETIVNAHGGIIEARNRTDGKGLEVIFTLPLEGKEIGEV